MTTFRTYELAVEVYRECEMLDLKGELKSQLKRATSSAVLNLAEGAAKPTKADKKRFYANAYGSIRETQAILRLANTGPFDKADRLGGGAAWRLIQATR